MEKNDKGLLFILDSVNYIRGEGKISAIIFES